MKREICEKCKHYVQHYGLYMYGGVYKINCGHCLEHQMSKKQCTKFELIENLSKKDTYLFNRQVESMLNCVQSLSKELKLMIETLKEIQSGI